ncbi:MAG: hypothetical protein SNJ72_07970, partial [Fimbriimonadales bacterium]
MTSVEATGNTLEEAKYNAMQMLGAESMAQVAFEVLDENSPVRVRATLMDEASQPYVMTPETARKVAEYVDHLVKKLRI